jgi:hypothetical protein
MKAVDPASEIMFGHYGGAECFFADVDGDGRAEALVYDRRGLWVYPLV